MQLLIVRTAGSDAVYPAAQILFIKFIFGSERAYLRFQGDLSLYSITRTAGLKIISWIQKNSGSTLRIEADISAP
jgi:hypothetical protein